MVAEATAPRRENAKAHSFYYLLQQRCNQTQHALSKLHCRRLLLRILLCYFPAHRGKYLQNPLVPSAQPHTDAENAIFKMEIQTSVIQVDRADRRCHIVADALLCVESPVYTQKSAHPQTPAVHNRSALPDKRAFCPGCLA